MNYKLLFLDIDGTIVTPDQSYTDLTKEAILKSKENGLEVILATGRPLQDIRDLMKDFNIQSTITHNGAYVEYNNETIVCEFIDQQTVTAILHLAKKYGQEVILFSQDSNYVTSKTDSITIEFMELVGITNVIELDNNNSLDLEILSITVVNTNEESLPYYEGLQGMHMTQVNIEGFTHCYDFTKDGVNKGTAIKKLLQHLDVSSSQTIAFGDGMNDVQMMQTVGASVAMGNANPELFKFAKFKTKSVEESGIYFGLKELKVFD